jgi:hypothetical protein
LKPSLHSLVNNIFNEKYVSNGYYFTFDDDFSNPGTISVEGAGFTHKQESISSRSDASFLVAIHIYKISRVGIIALCDSPAFCFTLI